MKNATCGGLDIWPPRSLDWGNQVLLPMKDQQPPDPLSFATAQALFCQALQARNASPRTVTAYSDDVIQFVA